jgi:hypothetical protein
MYNDLGGPRRRGTTVNNRGKSCSLLFWKIGLPLLLGLALLAIYVQRSPIPDSAVVGTSQTAEQHINCTTPKANVTCNCPPAAINISDAATPDGLQRLANKVTTKTVEKIVDAAGSTNPTDQTVRVSGQ